jgi:hypothetical protein
MHLGSILSISDDDLRELFRRTLAESIGYPATEAHAMASALVNSLSPGVGLMVRPASDETRFFHRSVLEFLAAERMLTRPSHEQIGLFEDHLADGRWSQVLRFLIRGLVRPPEISVIFDALDQASGGDPPLREHTNLLAADVAVGAGQADAPTRRRLLDRVIREIETGERTLHRAHLIDSLAVGLARPEIRGELLTRFEGWGRAAPYNMWPAVLNAAANWEPDQLLLDMLWHALLMENDGVHRVAGRILGTCFGGNHAVADRLAELANTTRLPYRRAAAVEALSLGWPRHQALDSLIATGRGHTDFAVRQSSIAADLRRRNITGANRSTLIELLDHSPTLTQWSDGLMELLVEYYPGDQVIFDHYVERADPTVTDQIRYGSVPAMYLILKGYTTRPEAKEFFLKFIAADRKDFPTTPTNLTDRVPWREIGEVYHTDEEVVAGVERLVDEYGPAGTADRDVYFCIQVARTARLRDKLIARVESKAAFGIGWAIKALLEGWPDDPAVQDALRRLVDAVGGRTPDGAIWFLPEIIADAEAALGRLAELATETNDQDAVAYALGEIVERGVLRDDPRTAAILDRALAQDMTNSWTSPEPALYTYFPEYAGVRELALARLDDRDTPFHKIAYGFRGDDQMRRHIAARFRGLSPPLRGRLVEGLADAPLAETGATALLGRYDTEPDPTVKLLTAIAFAQRLASTKSVTDGVIDTFTEQARSLGPDLDVRRAAAFAALARLGRLDKLTDLDERFRGGPVQFRHSLLSDAALFSRVVCRHWIDVKAALGDDFAHRFGYDSSPDDEFWRNILAVAYDYPATRADLAALLEQRPALAESAAGVTYLSRVEPGSDRLWKATTGLLRGADGGTFADIQPPWTALSILEDQFADDPRTSAWLDAELSHIAQTKSVHNGRTYLSMPSFGVIAAIARLRRTHPALRELLAQAQHVEGEPWHTFAEWTELATAAVLDARVFVDLGVEISRLVRINDTFPEYIHRPLTARLRRDASLAAAVAELVPKLSGDAVGIAVRLLSLSGRVNGALVDHLRSRLSNPRNQNPDTFDPLVGQASHIELLVLDVLDTLDT